MISLPYWGGEADGDGKKKETAGWFINPQLLVNRSSSETEICFSQIPEKSAFAEEKEDSERGK